jgi:NADP-dependent 3-hydroxy acid dehydrogenase YdfG
VEAEEEFDFTGAVERILGKALASAGAKVALNFQNNVVRAEGVLAELQKAGLPAALVRGDFTDEDSVRQMTEEIARTLGPIDILVLNATPPQLQKPIEEYDWAFYQQMLDFFIKSPFLLIRACLPYMNAQRWERIINVGSEAVQRAVSPFTAYVAAKGKAKAADTPARPPRHRHAPLPSRTPSAPCRTTNAEPTKEMALSVSFTLKSRGPAPSRTDFSPDAHPP